MEGQAKGATGTHPSSGLEHNMSLKERGRGRSSLGGSSGDRIPKFAGGGANSMRGTQPKLPPPAGDMPDALQNIDSGQARLEELGYVQELQRHFGLLGSVSAGFSSMAYLMLITGSLPIGLLYGGPVSVLWGWVLISVLQFTIALALAELASSYPLAGGPYFWCVELSGNDQRLVIVAWVTGWLNVLGQFASTAGSGYLTAIHLGEMIQLSSGHVMTKQDDFLVYAIVLVLSGMLCSLPTRAVRGFSIFAAFWMIIAGAILFVLLPVCAPKLQAASFVFTGFTTDNKGAFGIPNNAYFFLLGVLSAEYGYIGMESPAQFAEETKRADRIVPWGIALSLPLNFILGLCYIFVILFCLPDDYLDPNKPPFTVPGLYYDIFQQRFGKGEIGNVFSVLPLIAIFNTTVMSMVTASRMLWSFARDGGVPMYRVWAAVSPFTQTPVNAVWAMTALAFLLGIPMLWSPTAFNAIGSITSLGLYLSYAAPIVLRIIYKGNFTPGPFQLGALSTPVLVMACMSIAFNIAVCVLPTQFPINASNLNWAPITAALVILVALAAWFFPVIGAGAWYQGKAHTLRDANVRGGERYVESSGTSASAASVHDKANIPLLDLLKSQLPKDCPTALELAGLGSRQTPAECTFSRQAGLFTVDEKSKSKVVELKPDMAVAQQLRSSIDIHPREPIKIRRHQKLMDLIRRRSTDESWHGLNLEKIAEVPETHSKHRAL